MGAKSFHFEPDNTADPHFRARKRNCGLCGTEFTTTPGRRCHCEKCRADIKLKNKQLAPERVKMPRWKSGGSE